MFKNIVIIGSSGAIGNAITKKLSELYTNARIYAFSRDHDKNFMLQNVIYNIIDYQDELSIEKSALLASEFVPIDLVIVATGILHVDNIMPEKSLKEISAEKFNYLFQVNTIVPALLAKYFIPKLNKDNISIFASLSARLGSISDNKIGGWYSYRASKTALNMIIKNAAIEVNRSNKKAVIVGLHPGTVDSVLSKPFQKNISSNKIFTPEFSANKLVKVLEKLSTKDSGKCFAWDGKEIEP